MELINSQVLKALGYTHIVQIWNDNIIKALPIEEAPTVDAVSRDIHDGVCAQIMWERDVAMDQLEEHGIPFGGIAPDVVRVTRCRDCQEARESQDAFDFDGSPLYECSYCNVVNRGHEYCSWGRKKAIEADGGAECENS